MTNQEYLERIHKHLEPHSISHAESVLKHLKEGDLLTVERCCGSIEEYFFRGFDGGWMVGDPTEITAIFNYPYAADDLFPTNITHINHCLVETLDSVHEDYQGWVRGKISDYLSQEPKPPSNYISALEELHEVVEDYLQDICDSEKYCCKMAGLVSKINQLMPEM